MAYIATVEDSHIDVTNIRDILVQGSSAHPVIRFVLDPALGGYSQGSHLVARMSGNNFDNSISMYLHPSNQVALRKRISGVDTFLGLTSFGYVLGTTYDCRIECKGNDFKIYINDVLKVSVTDDNALKTNTKVGMFLPVATSEAFDFFDNFSVKG